MQNVSSKWGIDGYSAFGENTKATYRGSIEGHPTMINKFFILSLIVFSTMLIQGCASSGTAIRRVAVEYIDKTPLLTEIELDQENTSDEARLAVPFARIAAFVYCEDDEHKQLSEEEIKFCSSILNNHPAFNSKNPPPNDSNLKKWSELLNWENVFTETEQKLSGLKFKAFARLNNQNNIEIIIGFRGTDFSSMADWRANLRSFNWFLPLSGKDQYELLHSKAEKIFIEARKVR